MRRRCFTQRSGTEKGWHWKIPLRINENGNFYNTGGSFDFFDTKKIYEEKRNKVKIRGADREWVFRNIPSSIVWATQIHHDWVDGARMYLISKGEHILRGRRGAKK